MGLVVGGVTGGQLLVEEQEEAEEVGEEQPGETGSTLTMAVAGGEAKQTGGVRTTVGEPEVGVGGGAVRTGSKGAGLVRGQVARYLVWPGPVGAGPAG